MPVRFVLGRAGTGKTHFCLEALLAELSRADDERRLILLVPEQAAFQMERTLALRAPGGGYWRAEVLSFSRLARRVLDRPGTTPDVLSPEAREFALRAVVARRGPSLTALRRTAATRGFFAQFGRLIEELLSENITPADLLSAAERLDEPTARRQTCETAQIYADYLAWLGPQRIDPATQLAVLRQRLEHVAWLGQTDIWVDGFAGFTGQEVDTLVALARRARNVTITLLLDPVSTAVRNPRESPDPLGLFCRTESTYQRLRQVFAAEGAEIQPPVVLQPASPPRFAAAPVLAALEAGLAAPSTATPQSAAAPTDELRVVECATHRDEVRAAARWIRASLIDARGALHFRDFALIARDLEPYADLVAEVFEEYEIPYFLDRRRSLRAHPLCRLLSALLDAVLTDFDVRPMVRLLRTRLLPLAREDVERLENLITNEVVRGVDWWRRPTWDFAEKTQPSATQDAARRTIVAALEPLLALASDPDAATGAVWATTLYAVLQRLGVERQLAAWIAEARAERRWESAETHRLAWDALCGVLDDLHAVLADTRLSAREVADLVASSLAELTLGLAPPALDQVLVSAIERSRHPDIKHAWVFAFNEGVFPARPPEDLLLSTTRRQTLVQAGLTALPVRRDEALAERLLAYIAFTRPARSLTISYAVVGDDGDKLLPSPFLAAHVSRALPHLAIEHDELHAAPTHVTELARGYLTTRNDAQHVQAGERYARLCARVRQVPALAGPLAWCLRGSGYANEPANVGNFRQPADSSSAAIWDTSPSEIETYLQCPFRHFVRFGLRLDEWRGPKPLRWDLGNAAHELLAAVTRRAMQEPGGVRAISDLRWQELLATAAGDYWQRRSPDDRARRTDLAFQSDLLMGLLRDVLVAHAARWRRGQFEPLACEVEFGSRAADATHRGLEIHSPDGSLVRVHGKIDRVDSCRDASPPLLLVYDYKSSGVGPVSQRFLTGKRLQLFLYLAALEQAQATATQPAGVFLAPLYPNLDVLENDYAAEADPADQLMYLYRPRGLVAEAAARQLDDRLGSAPSPVAQFRVKKDGSFYANCDARPADDVTQRTSLASRTVLYVAEGVRQGRIDVAPLVESHQRACRNCEFQAMCRFDPMYNPSRVAEVVLPRLDEAAPDAQGAA